MTLGSLRSTQSLAVVLPKKHFPQVGLKVDRMLSEPEKGKYLVALSPAAHSTRIRRLESIVVIDPDAFLRQEVESASPAKLRWLLIRKAIGLSQAVDQLWGDQRFGEADQWLLRIRDIFGELLSGVTDPTNSASQSVAELYTFLLAMLGRIESQKDRRELGQMIDILQIELETWQLFIQREQLSVASNSAESIAAPIPGHPGTDQTFEWAGLNIEA